MRKQLLALLIAMTAFSTAQATVYYVDGAKTDNTGDGQSWINAKKDVQEAINLCTTNTDEVWVKGGTGGTYYPTQDPNGVYQTGAAARDNAFYIKNFNIKLYGGFAGDETLASQRARLPTSLR